MKRMTGRLGLLAALCLPLAEAANQEIRARFQADPAQPSKNVFVNKTPNSGRIASGRPPPRIYRDQLFHLFASSRFKVMMQCDSFSFHGTECRLLGDKDTLPFRNVTWVYTKLSLPGGITGPDGAPVKDLVLKNNEWVGPFQPGHFVDRKAGNLRFEMPADAIAYVLRPGINDTLKGDITVIWDSDV